MAELGLAAARAVERGDYRAAADDLRAGQMKLLGEMLEAGNVSPEEAVEIIEAVDAMHKDFVSKHC
jgi:hypothetical protein